MNYLLYMHAHSNYSTARSVEVYSTGCIIGSINFNLDDVFGKNKFFRGGMHVYVGTRIIMHI
ncbi:hypothetical protein GUJ93_ZPchr0008g12789 [Zizania palustris]|uniref:Uncharacterized protein n=1 Tax=Zizania palustris TaxID=103762 RepID=A0A8J5V4E2_ZIZPA|nr:hypothetical protein GUJ93_ZPchr0008g12789 [Zizania palustris]